MSKSLIIAEKPSVAADLAKALGSVPKSGDHYENDKYVITSAVGHLVELEMPEDIDKKKYASFRTCHRYFREWAESGVFQKALEALVQELEDEGLLKLSESFLDGRFVPAKKGAMVSA